MKSLDVDLKHHLKKKIREQTIARVTSSQKRDLQGHGNKEHIQNTVMLKEKEQVLSLREAVSTISILVNQINEQEAT